MTDSAEIHISKVSVYRKKSTCTVQRELQQKYPFHTLVARHIGLPAVSEDVSILLKGIEDKLLDLSN
jgi:hypothetical protein